MAKPLTQFRLQSLKPQTKSYKVSDGGGLFVEVLPSGLMVWRYQYLLYGKREKVTIGTYREPGAKKDRDIVTLEKARDIHNAYKKLVQAGESPARKKQEEKAARKVDAERASTFRDLAERWFAEEVTHKSEGWQYTVRGWLNLDIFPALGARDPRRIEESDVRKLIEKIEKRGAPASANKVRAICKHIFAYAKRKYEVVTNPVIDVEAVKQPKTQSHRPLAVEEIGPFLKALACASGRETNKFAIRLLMLSLVRKDELRLAKWTEFDFDNRVWTIPAHRMKMRDSHRVYLSNQAVEILNRLREKACGSEYVLPSFSTLSRPIGHTTLNSVIDRLEINGARFVPHGFRATASTVLNESGRFRADVIERALAHKHRNKVRATYNQAEYANERVTMLQWWADYLDDLERGNIVIPSLFEQTAKPARRNYTLIRKEIRRAA